MIEIYHNLAFLRPEACLNWRKLVITLRGFTLLETSVAIIILTIIVLAVGSSQTSFHLLFVTSDRKASAYTNCEYAMKYIAKDIAGGRGDVTNLVGGSSSFAPYDVVDSPNLTIRTASGNIVYTFNAANHTLTRNSVIILDNLSNCAFSVGPLAGLAYNQVRVDLTARYNAAQALSRNNPQQSLTSVFTTSQMTTN